MKENKTKPDIRFKGFTEAWEQRKLKDLIVDLKSGLSRMLKNEDIGVPVVRANNIEDNKLDMNNDVKYWYNPDPQGAKIENYTIKKDDILINFINSEAKMGTATIVKKTPIRPIIYTTNILRMRTNTLLKPYFYLTHTNLQQYKNYIKQIMKPAVNQASFTTVDYKNYNLKIPKEDEQHKIELIFKNIDNLITLHQRECDQLKELKKSMLKKMFPRDESSIPEVRFAGFTDAWEQRKLGEVVEFYNGDRSSRYPTDSDIVPDGIPFINAGDLVSGRVKLDTANKITKEKYNELSGAKIQRGDIIYCLRGTLGKNAFIDNFDSGTVASSLVDIRPKKIVGKYLFQVLNSDIEYRQRTINDEGAAQPNLSAKNLSLFDIPMSNKDEQTKIAEYFSNLDNLITLHQRELEILKNLKKTCLKRMFI